MKVICDHANISVRCRGCKESKVHEHNDNCIVTHECERIIDTIGVRCYPLKTSSDRLTPILSKSELLTVQPRELTLEEIAVAAMVGLISSTPIDAELVYATLANSSYNIAEAMKAEKERREKKSEERNG